ncbi:MAG: hypothetical protein AB1505_35080 [Candidatus Latescibacterota bacterium]
MTGIDTNVLVRYLTQDDLDQAARVNALMAETEARDERLFASDVIGRRKAAQHCTTTWSIDRGTPDLPYYRLL